MKDIFLEYKNIHFVGIGGIGMSALAKLCLNAGISISGSDKQKTNITEELRHLGAKIFYRHQKSNVVGADLVVYTCAVDDKNVEISEAKNKGIKIVERAEFLGKISSEYKNVIAVAGSHGKTTVCGMVAKIFELAGKEPTVLVGGEINGKSNLIIGKKDFLIVEACEYKEHFLKIGHNTGVVLNVDYDHPDYFKTTTEYEVAFQKFVKNSKEITITDEKYSILFGGKILTFGSGGVYQAKHVKYDEDKISYDVYRSGKFFLKIKLNCMGAFNVKNSLCSVAICDYYGIDKKYIKEGLLKFENLKRRYEYMGKIKNNVVITDYAHHPTQLETCIKTTQKIYKRNITVVFEPHTYSRTKKFLPQFVDALCYAQKIIILPTYSARERPIKGGTSRDLFEMLKFKKANVSFVKSYKKCLKELEKTDGSIILILGAGSVIKLANTIKQNYINLSEK